MATGIGLLLKSWHNAFYRFGPYDPARLTACLEENMLILDALRERMIHSFASDDESQVRRLFSTLTAALKGGKKGEQESTVATAKAMHILAPGFLPLWDNPIAGAYGQFPMWAHGLHTGMGPSELTCASCFDVSVGGSARRHHCTTGVAGFAAANPGRTSRPGD